MKALSLEILGSPQIFFQKIPIQVDTRKAIALLIYLVIAGNNHTRDKLSALLWPEYDQSRARAALRRTLSVLKKSLDGQIIRISRETIEIDSNADIFVDVFEFDKLVESVQAHRHRNAELCSACRSNLTSAVNLYRGDFLAGFTLRDSPSFDEWQFFETDRLNQKLSFVLELLTNARGIRGEFNFAIEHGKQWLSQDKLNESAHQTLMKLYSWSGYRNNAIKQYRECVRILEKELGVSPLEETKELYRSIKDESFSTKSNFLGKIDSTQEFISSAELSPGTKLSDPPIIGREANLQELIDTYHSAFEGGYFFVLEGETGIGKTRLADEFLNHVTSGGANIIKSRCYPGERELNQNQSEIRLQETPWGLQDRAP